MNEQQTQSIKQFFTKKVIAILAGIILVLVLIGAGFSYWYISIYQGWNPKQVSYKDPKFTDAEKEAYNNKIKSDNEKLAQSPSQEDKYKLLVDKGVQYYSLGQFIEARKAYQDATTVLPKNPTAWAELYHTEFSMENYIRANRAIDKALEINKTNPQFWIWKLEVNQDQLKATSNQLEQIYKDSLKATNAPELYVRYSRFLEDKGDLGGAVAQLKLAIEANPSSQSVYQAEITRIQDKLK